LKRFFEDYFSTIFSCKVTSDWNQLVDAKSNFKLIYSLQIIHSLLPINETKTFERRMVSQIFKTINLKCRWWVHSTSHFPDVISDIQLFIFKLKSLLFFLFDDLIFLNRFNNLILILITHSLLQKKNLPKIGVLQNIILQRFCFAQKPFSHFDRIWC
jgi:hypothetical protein